MSEDAVPYKAAGNEDKSETPVEILVGMVEVMLKRSEQYRREAEEDGDINEGEKHARVSSVLKEIVRLGKNLKCPESSTAAENTLKFWRGPGGALMCSMDVLGAQELSFESSRYYGGMWFIGESITLTSARLIAHALGGEFLE